MSTCSHGRSSNHKYSQNTHNGRTFPGTPLPRHKWYFQQRKKRAHICRQNQSPNEVRERVMPRVIQKAHTSQSAVSGQVQTRDGRSTGSRKLLKHTTLNNHTTMQRFAEEGHVGAYHCRPTRPRTCRRVINKHLVPSGPVIPTDHEQRRADHCHRSTMIPTSRHLRDTDSANLSFVCFDSISIWYAHRGLTAPRIGSRIVDCQITPIAGARSCQ